MVWRHLSNRFFKLGTKDVSNHPCPVVFLNKQDRLKSVFFSGFVLCC